MREKTLVNVIEIEVEFDEALGELKWHSGNNENFLVY